MTLSRGDDSILWGVTGEGFSKLHTNCVRAQGEGNAPMICRLSILLIESDEQQISLFTKALTKTGFSCSIHSARNAEETLAHLATVKKDKYQFRSPLPSLILLETKLGAQSGLDVLRWLRTLPELKPVPIVILASSFQPADVQSAYELGANSFLTKPAAFAELVAMVRNLCAYWGNMNEGKDIRW